jgi:hypothetical protein
MARKKQRSDSAEAPLPAIIDEVDTFEELAPRLHELSLNAPARTRVYVRIAAADLPAFLGGCPPKSVCRRRYRRHPCRRRLSKDPMPTDTEERILATDPRIRLPDRDARRVLGQGFICEKNEGNESLKTRGTMAPDRAKGATPAAGPGEADRRRRSRRGIPPRQPLGVRVLAGSGTGVRVSFDGSDRRDFSQRGDDVRVTDVAGVNDVIDARQSGALPPPNVPDAWLLWGPS